MGLDGNTDNGSWEACPILSRLCKLGKAFLVASGLRLPRSANEAADFVASHYVAETSDDSVWVERPPLRVWEYKTVFLVSLF